MTGEQEGSKALKNPGFRMTAPTIKAQYTQICTVGAFVSTEIMQCRNDEYFLILAAFLKRRKNWLVQKGTPRKTFRG